MKNHTIVAMADIIGMVEVGNISASRGMALIKEHAAKVDAIDFLTTFWADGKTLKNRFRTLKMGNDKLDKSIGIWSLPAGDAYPNCKSCIKTCYAMGPQRMRTNVRRSRFLNWVLAEYYSLAFIHWTVTQIKLDKVRTVRIHEAGDFYHAEYLKMWAEIAKHCKATKFYFYTKTDYTAMAAFKALPNVNMVDSILPDGTLNYGKPEYVTEKSKQYGFPICPATDPAKEAKTKCGKTCKLCQTHANVLFFLY